MSWTDDELRFTVKFVINFVPDSRIIAPLLRQGRQQRHHAENGESPGTQPNPAGSQQTEQGNYSDKIKNQEYKSPWDCYLTFLKIRQQTAELFFSTCEW